MDEAVKTALENDRLVDITTTGRKTGRPHRIEIRPYHFDGGFYLAGRPRPKQKDWYLNMLAHPSVTVHLKESVQADVTARGPGTRGRPAAGSAGAGARWLPR